MPAPNASCLKLRWWPGSGRVAQRRDWDFPRWESRWKKNTELLGRRGGEIPLKWVINPVINWRSRVIFHSCHWGELPRLRFVSHNVPPESPIPYGKLMGIGVPSGRQNIFHGLLDHYHLAIPKDWNYLMEMQFLLTTEKNTYRTNYLGLRTVHARTHIPVARARGGAEVAL